MSDRRKRKNHQLMLSEEFRGEYGFVRISDVVDAVGPESLRYLGPNGPNRYGIGRSWTNDLATALHWHRRWHDDMKRELQALRTEYRMLHAALMDEKRRNLA